MDNKFGEKVKEIRKKAGLNQEEFAKELGYKYVEIFNMDEFNTWYQNPSLTYEEYKHPTTLKYDRDEYFAQKANGRDIYGNDSNPHYSN